ncbi:MAG: DotI/IcmL family type IV secretion protein [Legionellales bacterium]
MINRFQLITGLCLISCSQLSGATPDKTQLAVWANEAIVATYTYDYKNYLQEQKEIAIYFTSEGWMAYSKALNASKLPDSVQKNNYYVSAVATQPPQITLVDPLHWQAMMPLLVHYKNPQSQQQQNLKVVITFSQAPAGQGVRGLSITSLQSTIISPPCPCSVEQ